jgi:hypothetical protein
MCDKCVGIDEQIHRYRTLHDRITYQQMQQATARLIAVLEAEKAAPGRVRRPG